MRLPVGIGATVGSFLGMLPGAGGPIAAFISYDYAKKSSKNGDSFGKGTVEGIAAPEAANNAVTGGALIIIGCGLYVIHRESLRHRPRGVVRE